MDLLLDANVIVDHCLNRQPYVKVVNLAMAACHKRGGRLWLYAGSVQTLEYVTFKELLRKYKNQDRPGSAKQVQHKARKRLHEFVSDKQWLAALAIEGDVYSAFDSEDEQLIRALDRFDPGSIKLLTRDQYLLTEHPEKSISPEQYCRLKTGDRQLDFIDLKTQQDSIRPQLEKNIHRILHHGRYIMGPEVKVLEQRLADYVGVSHCITASSGTDTLLIAMMALGIGPGDEVITSPFTFIATGEMIVLIGATPVFVDIDPQTYNIDPAKIEAAITVKTKAIMPVSLYGQCAELDTINAIAVKHNLPVIEDGAQSFGATYKDSKSCGLTTIGSTSFFPSKPLGSYGDGGALFTNDDDLAKRMRELRVHGQDRRYHHPRIGVNGRLDSIQAAIVLVKLERFDWEVEQREKIGLRYTQLINEHCPTVTTPFVAENSTSVYAQYTIQVDERDKIAEALSAKGIPTAVHYPVPLHRQPAFSHLSAQSNQLPVAERMAERVMSLPMSPDLTETDEGEIVQQLKQALR